MTLKSIAEGYLAFLKWVMITVSLGAIVAFFVLLAKFTLYLNFWVGVGYVVYLGLMTLGIFAKLFLILFVYNKGVEMSFHRRPPLEKYERHKP